MPQASLELLQSAVLFLVIFAVGLALLVYFMMDIRYRRQLTRNARKLILASKVAPTLNTESLRALWSKSGRFDRDLLEEILADLCRSTTGAAKESLGNVVREAGILDRWVRDLEKGRVSRRVRAAMRLAYIHDARGIDALVKAAEDRSEEVRLAVALSLGRLADPRGIPGLIRITQRSSSLVPDLTLAAALAACSKGRPAKLMELLQAREARERVVGAWALSEVADPTVLGELLRATQDAEGEVRAKVARALARVPGPESAGALVRLARDPIWFVRIRALDALGRLHESSGETVALIGIDDNMREVRYRGAFALRQIRGMKGDLATQIVTTRPRRSSNSLLSEWERAAFLWNVVAGLSTRDWPQFLESREVVRALSAAGVTRALVHSVLVFPNLKVRLRVLRLLAEGATAGLRRELEGLAGQPGCDPRVARALRRAFPQPESRPAGAGDRASG